MRDTFLTRVGPIGAMAVAATLLGTSMAAAQATDIESMTGQLNTQMRALSDFAGMIAFLSGFVFGIMGFMKLRANAANPQDPSNKPTTGFALIIVGAALIAVPTVMGIGVQSLFGGPNANGSTTLEEDGTGFNSLAD